MASFNMSAITLAFYRDNQRSLVSLGKTSFLPSTRRTLQAYYNNCIQIKLHKNLNYRIANMRKKIGAYETKKRLIKACNDFGSNAYEIVDDKLREECGIVGILGDPKASSSCFRALHTLQHRGQDGAGIVSVDELNGNLHVVKGLGLVSKVFNQPKIFEETLIGSSAIGHVRYATSGDASALENVQPFVSLDGSFAVAHNGNLTNAEMLKEKLQEDGITFNTSSDTEVILHLLNKSLKNNSTMTGHSILTSIIVVCQQLEGAFSLVILTKDKVVAIRDSYGFRPLVMGKQQNNGAFIFASETCALDAIQAQYIREIQPGEVVVVEMHQEGESSYQILMDQKLLPERKACTFELIYFAFPTSIVFGLSVWESRYKWGQILAKVAPVDCDVVISVPDSANIAAHGYAHATNVPFHHGLLRSPYVSRTFIEPTQELRESAVSSKFVPVDQVLKGKRVVVIDDSIVRGTTSKRIVKLIRDAGAIEVHMRIASPPIVESCYYGIDTPNKDELISYKLSVEATRKEIGVDSLAFLPLERLQGMLQHHASTFCYACMSSNYPI